MCGFLQSMVFGDWLWVFRVALQLRTSTSQGIVIVTGDFKNQFVTTLNSGEALLKVL
jgi:hypothetical protein